MAIAIGHLKVIHDLALVPDVIAGGDHIDVQFEKLFGESRRDAEAGGRILSVGNHQVNGLIAHDAGQAVFDNGAAGASENVTDKKNAHDGGARFDGNTRSEQVIFSKTTLLPSRCR